ncbi:MAG: hypothetical protein PHY15_00250 [Eubacteriales bacterium]|nr:hypothetical protein [Eubacteriales bacterium]MDD4475539.1 hypothetical protein [Eubacteriales bacterium]
MSLLSELTTMFEDLGIPVETGVFSGKPPEMYAVFTPLSDTFESFADNVPNNEIQEVRISLFNKGNYIKTKNSIIRTLLTSEITITERRYIGYETDTGFHHYLVDCSKCYEIQDLETEI